MKFYTGDMFPAEYKNGIFIADMARGTEAQEAGLPDSGSSRSIPTARTPRSTVFAGVWLDDQKILGRPADVLQGARRLPVGRRRPGRRDLPDQLSEVDHAVVPTPPPPPPQGAQRSAACGGLFSTATQASMLSREGPSASLGTTGKIRGELLERRVRETWSFCFRC